MEYGTQQQPVLLLNGVRSVQFDNAPGNPKKTLQVGVTQERSRKYKPPRQLSWVTTSLPRVYGRS